MPSFLELQRASFEGIEFPVYAVTVTGGIRDHVHEYPHANGGSPEKMGRRLYDIKMDGTFQDTFRGYPHLWPVGLQKLRRHFEDQTTGDLVIPTIGKIQAYCRQWVTQQVKGMLSGELAQLEFREDQGLDNLVKSDITTNTIRLRSEAPKFTAALKALEKQFQSEKDMSIFDAVSNAINGVLAIQDQLDSAGSLFAAKMASLSSLVQQATHTATANDYANYPLISSLNIIGEAAISASTDVTQERRQIANFYIVPNTMPMSNISVSIYGDTQHTTDLMLLNDVDDVFAVRAGTSIKYYGTHL